MLKVNSRVVSSSMPRPPRKRISATFSQTFALGEDPLISIKEKIQLAMNRTVVAVVISSMNVTCDILRSFSDVSTTKHKPRRLEEALRIWGDFWFWGSSAINSFLKITISRPRLYRCLMMRRYIRGMKP